MKTKTNNYAFQINTTFKSMFHLENLPNTFGLGLIANENFIEKNPFIPMVMILGNFYNKASLSHKARIDDFIESYSWLMDKSIEEIGNSRMEKIIKKFNNIISTI